MIEKIKNFGKNNPDICAIITFGSLHSCDISDRDDFSDLDIFVFTKNPDKYLNPNDSTWITNFGEPTSVLVLKNPFENNMINRIMLNDYFSLDVIPISFNKFKLIKLYFILKKLNLHRVIANHNLIESELKTFYTYLSRGYSIIYDKKNIVDLIQKIEGTYKQDILETSITEKEFQENYNDFWQTAYKLLGTITRDELYYGILTLDNVLKKRLIEVIEWESQIFNKHIEDTYYFGKRIKQWANRDTLESLQETFFNHQNENSYITLKKNIELYKKISDKISKIKNYNKNIILENQVSDKLLQYVKLTQ
ncbi:aminoglycoside 6-adenylyltransferase [uncultured Aquimarina sp.]|uniref:aminoglycoside 6-adenylyltransferase n=1 Tax=uncultured Aquimarina sp. TaxID=575652 RepID=UPI00262D2DA4|nr:aminoglycoside 6-adenylyltransferase [uncultured Aquimarina sp.]